MMYRRGRNRDDIRQQNSLRPSRDASKGEINDIDIDVVLEKQTISRLNPSGRQNTPVLTHGRSLKPPNFGGYDIPDIVVTRESPLRRDRIRGNDVVRKPLQKINIDDTDELSPTKPQRKVRSNHLIRQVEQELSQKQKQKRESEIAIQTRQKQVWNRKKDDTIAIDDVDDLNEGDVYKPVKPLFPRTRRDKVDEPARNEKPKTQKKSLIPRARREETTTKEIPRRIRIDEVLKDEKPEFSKRSANQRPEMRTKEESPKKTVKFAPKPERLSRDAKRNLVASLFETPKLKRGDEQSFSQEDSSDDSLTEFMSQERLILEEEEEEASEPEVVPPSPPRSGAVTQYLSESRKLMERVRLFDQVMPEISRRRGQEARSPAKAPQMKVKTEVHEEEDSEENEDDDRKWSWGQKEQKTEARRYEVPKTFQIPRKRNTPEKNVETQAQKVPWGAKRKSSPVRYWDDESYESPRRRVRKSEPIRASEEVFVSDEEPAVSFDSYSAITKREKPKKEHVENEPLIIQPMQRLVGNRRLPKVVDETNRNVLLDFLKPAEPPSHVESETEVSAVNEEESDELQTPPMTKSNRSGPSSDKSDVRQLSLSPVHSFSKVEKQRRRNLYFEEEEEASIDPKETTLIEEEEEAKEPENEEQYNTTEEPEPYEEEEISGNDHIAFEEEELPECREGVGHADAFEEEEFEEEEFGDDISGKDSSDEGSKVVPPTPSPVVVRREVKTPEIYVSPKPGPTKKPGIISVDHLFADPPPPKPSVPLGARPAAKKVIWKPSQQDSSNDYHSNSASGITTPALHEPVEATETDTDSHMSPESEKPTTPKQIIALSALDISQMNESLGLFSDSDEEDENSSSRPEGDAKSLERSEDGGVFDSLVPTDDTDQDPSCGDEEVEVPAEKIVQAPVPDSSAKNSISGVREGSHSGKRVQYVKSYFRSDSYDMIIEEEESEEEFSIQKYLEEEEQSHTSAHQSTENTSHSVTAQDLQPEEKMDAVQRTAEINHFQQKSFSEMRPEEIMSSSELDEEESEEGRSQPFTHFDESVIESAQAETSRLSDPDLEKTASDDSITLHANAASNEELLLQLQEELANERSSASVDRDHSSDAKPLEEEDDEFQEAVENLLKMQKHNLKVVMHDSEAVVPEAPACLHLEREKTE